MTDHLPIKRHDALAALSRDHHFGLLLCWKIRQGMNKLIAPERISNYVLYFFREELESHFIEEEHTIFPLLPLSEPLRLQAEAEHASIRSLVRAIDDEKSSINLLTEFADSLQAHIRFEERVLFNHLQNALTEEQLQHLLRSVDEGGRKDIDAGWYDIFWSREPSSL